MLVRGLIAVAVLLPGPHAPAALPLQRQTAAAARITFHFVRPGVPVPEYTFTLDQGGGGSYAALAVPVPTGPDGPYAERASRPAPLHFSSSFILPQSITARLFDQVRNADLARDCASKARNIADTGAKTLTYSAPEGGGRCQFNYTENKAAAAVSQTIQALAFTLDSGYAMERAQRFDRLGLDREMNDLISAVRDGRALAPGLIASELNALANDQQVLGRVRRDAAKLLDQAALAR